MVRLEEFAEVVGAAGFASPRFEITIEGLNFIRRVGQTKELNSSSA
jgi:hypothetical protein